MLGNDEHRVTIEGDVNPACRWIFRELMAHYKGDFEKVTKHVRVKRLVLSEQDRVQVWGTGTPRREFLHVDDLADACLHLMLHYNEAEPVNIGTGRDISIQELADLVSELTGYAGEILFDFSKPDGTPRKLLDVSKLQKLGWHHSIGLRQGITAVLQSAGWQRATPQPQLV